MTMWVDAEISSSIEHRALWEKCLYTHRVLNRCGDRGQLNWLVKRVLHIGVGGCSIVGGGHRPWAVLVCCRQTPNRTHTLHWPHPQHYANTTATKQRSKFKHHRTLLYIYAEHINNNHLIDDSTVSTNKIFDTFLKAPQP
jgi:hypothetical protein